jgi:hypothetical protein
MVAKFLSETLEVELLHTLLEVSNLVYCALRYTFYSSPLCMKSPPVICRGSAGFFLFFILVLFYE